MDTNRPTIDQVIEYLTRRLDGMTMPGAVRMTTAARDYLVELRDEMDRVKRERYALIEDFVDMRGWCTGKDCRGFYPSGASGQKEE